MIALRFMCKTGSGLCINHGTHFSKPTKMFVARLYSQEARDTVWKTGRTVRKKTISEWVRQPAGETAFGIGKGAVAGGAVFGIGALCYYGLGLSNDVGAIENSRLWPQYVKDRVRDTYMYFGSSVLLTAASSVMIFRSPAMLNIMMKNSWVAIGATMAAMIGTGILAQTIEYQPGFGPKQMAWMLHSATVGAVIAPMCMLGGPLLLRAALYTFGVVGGLSTVAACAPSDQFLYMGGPLAVGLGLVFASSIGSMFVPATTALGAGMMSVSLYGGLLLFSGFLLYDTQRIIRKAETHPLYATQLYDPINASISIYLDTLNIFIRIAMIMAGGGNKRK